MQISARSGAAYDVDGYPVGFDRSGFEETDDYDAEDELLEAIEGSEFPVRARERYRLRWIRSGLRGDALAAEMARYDAEPQS